MPRLLKTRDYAKLLAAKYPHLTEASIAATCTEFMRVLYGVLHTNHEVRLRSDFNKNGPLSLKIYKVNFDVDEVRYRAYRGRSRRWRERAIRRRRVKIAKREHLGPITNLFEINPR